ncbi:MAG: hypothetical protein GXP32_04395 [Kiritimatiellaeota bacterium]|nr:hypothetical protein [Kiritimatiellota bacterium]
MRGASDLTGLVLVAVCDTWEERLNETRKMFAAEHGADGIVDADAKIAKALSATDDKIVKMIIWD